MDKSNKRKGDRDDPNEKKAQKTDVEQPKEESLQNKTPQLNIPLRPKVQPPAQNVPPQKKEQKTSVKSSGSGNQSIPNTNTRSIASFFGKAEKGEQTQPADRTSLAKGYDTIAEILQTAARVGTNEVFNKKVPGDFEKEFTDAFVASVKKQSAQLNRERGIIEIDPFNSTKESETGADVCLTWTNPENGTKYLLYLQLKVLYNGYNHYASLTKQSDSSPARWAACKQEYFDMVYKSTAQTAYRGEYQTIRLQEMESKPHAMSAWLVVRSPGKDFKKIPTPFLLPISNLQTALGKAKGAMQATDIDHLDGDQFMRTWNSRTRFDISSQANSIARHLETYYLSGTDPVPEQKPVHNSKEEIDSDSEKKSPAGLAQSPSSGREREPYTSKM